MITIVIPAAVDDDRNARMQGCATHLYDSCTDAAPTSQPARGCNPSNSSLWGRKMALPARVVQVRAHQNGPVGTRHYQGSDKSSQLLILPFI